VSRFVTERCVTVSPARAAHRPSSDVLELARSLAPYLAVRPAEVTAALARCGVDPHRRPITR
jgi:hypothetical protein